MKTCVVVLALSLAGGTCLGQTADDSRPASTNVMGQEYPRDTFAWVGGFSGVPGGAGGPVIDTKTAFSGVLADATAFNRRMKLVWFGIGSAEPARMMEGMLKFRDAMSKAGIEFTFYESPGTSHEWLTWRRDLRELAPRLFRE